MNVFFSRCASHSGQEGGDSQIQDFDEFGSAFWSPVEGIDSHI